MDKIVSNLIQIRTSNLRPYGKNPRKNDAAVDAVAESIREFGFKVPIIIDADYEIIAGHTRWKAAQKLGLQTVPCIMANDLTEEQVRAFRLADNKTAELSEWDINLLDEELRAITEIDMSAFGFGSFEDAQEQEEVHEDDFEEKEENGHDVKRGAARPEGVPHGAGSTLRRRHHITLGSAHGEESAANPQGGRR